MRRRLLQIKPLRSAQSIQPFTWQIGGGVSIVMWPSCARVRTNQVIITRPVGLCSAEADRGFPYAS